MPKFSLSSGEMMHILYELHPNAYDRLVNELEKKILDVLSEKKWIEIWTDGDFKLEFSVVFDDIEELKDGKN
jgi:hypothetical protein